MLEESVDVISGVTITILKRGEQRVPIMSIDLSRGLIRGLQQLVKRIDANGASDIQIKTCRRCSFHCFDYYCC